MEDWSRCPGYLLTGKSVDNLLAVIRSESEKQLLRDEMVKEHLDKQDKITEEQTNIIKKLFDKVDANKLDSDEKIENVKNGINKLFWKITLMIGGVLITIIGLLLWRLPSLISWLATFIK